MKNVLLLGATVTAGSALVKFAVKIILNDYLYSRESVSITHDAAKVIA